MDFFEALGDKREKQEVINRISSMPSNYVGSKRRLLVHIWDILDREGINFDSVFDAFSGSAMVSLLFKSMGKKVFSNDLLTSSAITAICLLENNSVPLTQKDLKFLCANKPDKHGSFVKDNYKDKFFTESECDFLDRYKANVETLCGEKFYCGMELLNKATLFSIPNSNFSVYGKNLKSLRSTHEVGRSFWTEKWRDTTRKRRNANNEIMFDKNLSEMYDKYKGAFSLFAIEHHVNQHCFLGGRYYNGQTVASLKHRLEHPKNKKKEITDIPVSVDKFKDILETGNGCVFNADIIELLEAKMVETDLIYLDPPYGGASSDYSHLYRFLEEYLYECKLEEMEHIIKGGKRFSRSKGYTDQFETLLSLCSPFKTWLISYNESSFANIEVIVSLIKNSGRKNVKVVNVPITYQYRKGKNVVETDIEKYSNSGHKYLQRGTEYLILAN